VSVAVIDRRNALKRALSKSSRALMVSTVGVDPR
jgi:hypothetical protein